MIPPFDEFGRLPPGVHPATLAEITDRFGRLSELRRVQIESVHWMSELAQRAGIQRIILNGSFVTDIIDPNDVDCVLLIGNSFPLDVEAEAKLRIGLPFLDIALVRQRDFDRLVEVFFATDRFDAPKGMVEIVS